MERKITHGDTMDALRYLWAGLGGIEDDVFQVWLDQFSDWTPGRLKAAARHLKKSGWHRTYPQPADLWRADTELQQAAARTRAEQEAEKRMQDWQFARYIRPKEKPGLSEMFYELRASQLHAAGKHKEAERMEALAAEEKKRRLEHGHQADQLGGLIGAMGKV